MANIIEQVKSFVHSVGVFIKKLFNSAEKLYEELSPEVQIILREASAAVALIRSMEGSPAQFVVDKLLDKLPGYTPGKLEYVLSNTAKYLNIAKDVESPDLATLVGNIQKVLVNAGDESDAVAETVASWIGYFSTPDTTIFSSISATIKYVYETFVKGKY